MIDRKTILTGSVIGLGAVLFGASAALAGDPNAGDIWVDTATTQTIGVTAAGPGHENDPHLPCANVGVFAAKMADPTSAEPNQFTVYAWPPTGSQNAIYTAGWTYSKGAADPQEIAVIPVSVFGTGGHFKIQVAQDPVKQKVFWIDCDTAGKPGGGTVDSTPTPTPTPTPTSAPTSSPTPTPSPTPSGSVGGTAVSPSPTPGSGSGAAGGTGAVSSATATGNGAVSAASATAGGVVGALEGAVATAQGAVLAETGTPLFYLVLGLFLVVIGAGVYLARRRNTVL
jgi:hypothetical protein